MHRPKLYEDNNEMQKIETTKFLKKYLPQMNWKSEGERVLDIGCASGDVTHDILYTMIEGKTKQIDKFAGADVSQEMVNYVASRWGIQL